MSVLILRGWGAEQQSCPQLFSKSQIRPAKRAHAKRNSWQQKLETAVADIAAQKSSLDVSMLIHQSFMSEKHSQLQLFKASRTGLAKRTHSNSKCCQQKLKTAVAHFAAQTPSFDVSVLILHSLSFEQKSQLRLFTASQTRLAKRVDSNNNCCQQKLKTAVADCAAQTSSLDASVQILQSFMSEQKSHLQLFKASQTGLAKRAHSNSNCCQTGLSQLLQNLLLKTQALTNQW